MNYKEEVYSLLEKFRGELEPSDASELLFVASLIHYLEQDERYSKVANINSLLEAGNEIPAGLKKMLDIIEEEIPYFKDVFSHLSVLHNVNTTQLIEILYFIKSLDIEQVGYDRWCHYLIKQFESHMGGKGEHISPDTINKLAVEILSPSKGSFYGGTFGFGGGAVKALRSFNKKERNLEIWGQEISTRIYALAKIRFFMIGTDDAIIEHGDIFSKPRFLEGNTLKEFDYVYMDIPKSLEINYDFKNDPYNRFIYGKPSVRSGDLGYISHMLASLNKNGRAIVVVPDGTLFRGGVNATIRKNIIDANVIEAVISLPQGLYENTSIPVNLIVFNKRKSIENKDKVLFVNARDLITKGKRSKRYISDDDIGKMVNVIQSEYEVEEFSKYVQNDDIIDGSLLPSRYIISSEMVIPGYGEVKFDLDLLNRLKTTPLKYRATLFSGYNVGSKNKASEDGKFKIIRLSDVHDGELIEESIARYDIGSNARTERYLLKENDIILSIRGTSLKVAIVPKNDGNMLLSQNFIGLRCGDGLNPAFLKAYLESPVGQFLLTNKLSGTAIPTLRRKDIESLAIPDVLIKDQEEMMEQYLWKKQLVKKEIAILKLELEDSREIVLDGMGIRGVYEVIEE